MQRHLAYQFDSTQRASRFFHDIKSGDVEADHVRFHPDNYTVLVSYPEPACGGFNSISMHLDDLAETHAGWEVAPRL